MNTVLENETKVVISKRNGCLLQVVLNRPEKRNAFNPQVIEELTRIFSTDAQACGLRLIHLSGLGQAFCAGADLEWMAQSRNLSDEENRLDADKLFHMYQAMQNSPVPIVTQVHGRVFAGGIGLCSGSDIVIADEAATFSLSEARRGLIPAVMMPFVLEKMGKSRTRELTITGRVFSATEAENYGLVQFITSADNKERLTKQLIENIIASAPEAIVQARRLIETCRDIPFQALRHDLVNALASKRAGDEAQEGLNAFFEKRSPSWVNDDWSLDDGAEK